MRMLWALAVAAPLLGTIPPADWVPARWNWTDAKSLDFISGTPINCLLLKSVDAAFAASARERGNLPPEHTVIPGERYLQALADAALSGGRWILALDDDFAGRLRQGDAAALRDWKRIAQQLQFSEAHPEWRAMQPYGKLAIVQDP